MRVAVEARARLDGTAESLESLQDQLSSRDEEIRELNGRIASLSGERADAERLAEEAERSKLESLEALRAHHAELMREKNGSIEEQKTLLLDAERVLGEKFAKVSNESLKSAQEQFLTLAKEKLSSSEKDAHSELERRQRAIEQIVQPLKESLERVDKQNVEMEQKRISAYDSMKDQIERLSGVNDQLANALRKPVARGIWGEQTLTRILEQAGMIEGVHFIQQHSTESEEGRQRTDVVLTLPKDRMIVIDSKVPLETFMDAMNERDESVRSVKFGHHAKLVRDHVRKLAAKTYWSRYPSSPDCVVLFLPTEGAYQAAVDAEPSLLSDAKSMGVYLANPMTLINMAHLAMTILNEEKLRQNALEIREQGVQLYARLCSFAGHLGKVGSHLRQTVDHYNKAVGSMDRAVMPQARRMRELGASAGQEIELPPSVDAETRQFSSPDLQQLPQALREVVGATAN